MPWGKSFTVNVTRRGVSSQERRMTVRPVMSTTSTLRIPTSAATTTRPAAGLGYNCTPKVSPSTAGIAVVPSGTNIGNNHCAFLITIP